MVVEHKECRLCQDTDIQEVLDLGETPPANNFLFSPTQSETFYPLKCFICKNCGSFQLSHTVSPDILFQNYLYESSTSASFRKHFVDYAEMLVTRFKLKAGDIVIDCGSNDGIFLRPLMERGIRAIGVEPAKNLAEKCQKSGMEVYNEFFNPKSVLKMSNVGPAKIITANNVFAHADDLHSIIEAVKLMLHSDGVFIFEVAYLLDAFQKSLFDNQYHEHIFTHSVKPLRKLFQKHDMDLFDVQQISTHGGSIRCFVKRAYGQYPNWATIEAQINLEEEAGLYNLEKWKQFAQKIEDSKQNIKKLLTELKERGHSICGYGAPAKTTTLLHVLDISKDIINYITDDSPAKQGLYLPGKHIPILSKIHLDADYCVLTAWNFSNEIIKNNPDYKGKWIKIFPELQII